MKRVSLLHDTNVELGRRNQTQPTDFYYAELTSNWDPDGDGRAGELDATWNAPFDLHPELAVGRIPVARFVTLRSAEGDLAAAVGHLGLPLFVKPANLGSSVGISRVTRWAPGSFLFCEAAAFRKVGGFSQDLYAGEEIDLSRRLKGLARTTGRKLVILHRHPLMTSDRKLHLYSARQGLRFLRIPVYA